MAAFLTKSPVSHAQISDASPHQNANHLIHEKSPYLLLHVHNPLDWYPWGEEALQKAKREDKPIFLSVGYYTLKCPVFFVPVLVRETVGKGAEHGEGKEAYS